jgi:uncharacterized membrane protein YjfL (UPF0719 family)
MNQINEAAFGLRLDAYISTILYSVTGIILMVLAIVCFNYLFNLNARKELVEENNIAFGVMIGALAISIGIIIAGTISS